MDGAHDLGGKQGFGTVDVEPDEPVFHHRWEGRTFAVAGAALGAGGFNTPMFRHGMERMEPGHYLTSSYYEHWLTSVTTLLVEAGIVDHAELERRAGPFPLAHPPLVTADDVAPASDETEPRFSPGDAVRVRDIRFSGHTRCPGYVRGRRGVVVRPGPAAPVPELEAHRGERVVEPTCTVRFELTELWGDGAEAGAVHVDLYERYLEPA